MLKEILIPKSLDFARCAGATHQVRSMQRMTDRAVHVICDLETTGYIGEKMYFADGLHSISYFDTFAPLLDMLPEDMHDIPAYLASIASQEPVHAADFYGAGYHILNNPEVSRHITTFTGIALHNPKTALRKRYQSSQIGRRQYRDPLEAIHEDERRTQIEADLNTLDGWHLAKGELIRRKISGFNIAWCRANGPFSVIEGKVYSDEVREGALYHYAEMFSYMLSLMRPDSSLLFSQVPAILGERKHDLYELINSAGFGVVSTASDHPNYSDIMAVWRG